MAEGRGTVSGETDRVGRLYAPSLPAVVTDEVGRFDVPVHQTALPVGVEADMSVGIFAHGCLAILCGSCRGWCALVDAIMTPP